VAPGGGAVMLHVGLCRDTEVRAARMLRRADQEVELRGDVREAVWIRDGVPKPEWVVEASYGPELIKRTVPVAQYVWLHAPEGDERTDVQRRFGRPVGEWPPPHRSQPTNWVARCDRLLWELGEVCREMRERCEASGWFERIGGAPWRS